VSLGPDGALYVCEIDNHCVRRIDRRTGLISTVAGSGKPGYAGDGGPALASTWNGPKAIRCDRQDNILVVDTENHAIRRIDTVTGVVITVAGGHLGADGDGGDPTAAGLDRPHGVGVDRAGNLFIADSNNNRVRVVGLA
jgi:streptogramin lyase